MWNVILYCSQILYKKAKHFKGHYLLMMKREEYSPTFISTRFRNTLIKKFLKIIQTIPNT